MSLAKINAVASDHYGAGIIALSPTAALWVAEKIMQDEGVNVYPTIARARERVGKGTSFPAYKSICW
jgi:hypothetical protein